MNLLQIGISGPMNDPDSGNICTIDVRRESPHAEVFQKSYMVRTDNIAEAFKSAVKLVAINQLDQ